MYPTHYNYQLVQALILGKLGYSIFATMSRGGQIIRAVMVSAAQAGRCLTSGRVPSAALMRC
jgi:hypothetical protein